MATKNEIRIDLYRAKTDERKTDMEKDNNNNMIVRGGA